MFDYGVTCDRCDGDGIELDDDTQVCQECNGEGRVDPMEHMCLTCKAYPCICDAIADKWFDSKLDWS